MKIIGLHRLPFDERRLNRDIERFHSSFDTSGLRDQYRENHENAWIVVVEGDAEPDFERISHPDTGPNAQAAWLEQEIQTDSPNRRWVFFLHYVDPTKPLWYCGEPTQLPSPTPAPEALVRTISYCSPD